MASLYDLTGEYAQWAEYLEQTELDDDMEAALQEALNNIAVNIDDKLENYAKIIKNFESDIEGLKAEEARLSAKRKAMENSIKTMKERMMIAMQQTGRLDIKTSLFSFKVQKNPASVVMDEAYIENIPEQFLIQQDPKIDRKAIKAAIEAGFDLEGIAHLERTESIRIR